MFSRLIVFILVLLFFPSVILADVSMSLDISGLDQILNTCESKIITIDLIQTSSDDHPKDVKLVLFGLNYFLNAESVFCGGVTPVTCVPLIDGNGDYIWTFNDAFWGSGQSATITLDVQKRCMGAGNLSATVYYDDSLSDDSTSDEIFSVTASVSPVLLQTGDIFIEATPQVNSSDNEFVQWGISVTNRGIGNANNVWVDDVLSSGLVYEHGVNPIVVDNMTGVTINNSLDHNGLAINGISVLINEMAAGEHRQVTMIARQTGYANLTNEATASWGCISTNCQPNETLNLPVPVPVLSVIQTPLDSQSVCGSTQSWDITVTNNGSGNAQVVRIEDTPGDWIDVDIPTSTAGLTDMGGGLYGWEINNLAAGSFQTFTIVGTLNPDALPSQNDCTLALRQNNVEVIWGCGTSGDAIDNNPSTTDNYVSTFATPANATASILLMPDLVITEINPEITATADGLFSKAISVTVKNQGDGAVNSDFTVTIDDGLGWTGSGSHIGTLNPDDSATITIDTASWNPGCEGYSFTTAIDSNGNDICECNETNNALGPYTYTPAIPELIVTGIDFGSLDFTDGAVSRSVIVTIENTGSDITESFNVSLSTTGSLTFSDQTVSSLATGTRTLEFLGAGGDITETCTFTAIVDSEDSVSECVGADNTLEQTLSVLTVSNLNDNGAGSLRQSVADAGDGDIIRFGSLSGSITLASGVVILNKSIEIIGPEAGGLTISGNNSSRLFRIDEGANVLIEGLTLTGGFSNGDGGCISNSGNLTLNRVTICNSLATENGGGIMSTGSLTMLNSTLSGNSGNNGGGIYLNSASTTTMSHCTINNNSASLTGGGLYNAGTIDLQYSIIANSTGDDTYNDGTISSNILNLIEDGTSSPSITGDPLLTYLQDNGDGFLTHALKKNSPAVDVIDTGDCTASYDQRGVTRPKGAGCDIGAYELGNTVISITPDGSEFMPDSNITIRFTDAIEEVTLTNSNIRIQGAISGTHLSEISGGGTAEILCNPDNHFLPGERVTVIVTDAVENEANYPIAFPFIAQFTVDTEKSNGIFTESGQSSDSFAGMGISAEDINGDGYPDVVIAVDGPNRILLNDGIGGFSDSGQTLGNTTTHMLASGDFDDDGDPDFFAANNGSNRIWLNDNGVFMDSGQLLGSSESHDVALIDVDSDGDIDAVTANYGAANTVWLNDGAGAFSDAGQSLGTADSTGVISGDIDNDGDLDLFITNKASGNTVWLNEGNGSFTNSGQSLGSNTSRCVDFADLDNDGDLDAVVGNDTQGNWIWLNDGTGLFSDSGQRLGTDETVDIVLKDVDGDQDSDIVSINNGANTIWQNDGLGVFTDTGQNLGALDSRAGALIDIENDGDLDAVIVNHNQSIKVWKNVAPDIRVTGNGIEIVAGDIDPDSEAGTDFGEVEINTGSHSTAFTIENTGFFELIQTGAAFISVEGDHKEDFSVTSQPELPVVPNGGVTETTITFAPSATGTRTATVTISSNDPDENPYAFVITGFGWEDSDGDGVSDNSDAFPDDPDETSDNDNDLMGDNADTDDDNDGIPDDWELTNGLDPFTDNSGVDSDGDQLDDVNEFIYGTNPHLITNWPGIPKPELPEDSAVNQPLSTQLQTGYSNTAVIATHTKTRWQIAEDTLFDTIIFDLTTDQLLTSLIVPEMVLSGETTYFWRVLYIDGNETEWLWSEVYSFTTGSDSLLDENENGLDDTMEVPSGEETDLDDDGVVDADQSGKLIMIGDGRYAFITPVENITGIETFTWAEDAGAPPESPKRIDTGLFSFSIIPADSSLPVTVGIFISEPFSEGSTWFKYDTAHGWQGYSEFSQFSSDLKSVVLTLKDGGEGDVDGVVNGLIIDPSGPLTEDRGELPVNESGLESGNSFSISHPEDSCFIGITSRLNVSVSLFLILLLIVTFTVRGRVLKSYGTMTKK